MKSNRSKLFYLLMGFLLLQNRWVFSQEMSVADDIAFINARLSHSQIQRIGADGMVRIKAPGQIIQFNITKASFSYNDRMAMIGSGLFVISALSCMIMTIWMKPHTGRIFHANPEALPVKP